MSKLFYFVVAYSILWIVLFGYVLNLMKKQSEVKKELDRLKQELIRENRD
ncbi:MAG: CcmD family protein [Candidatus Zhuqueibacterota bacterium]